MGRAGQGRRLTEKEETGVGAGAEGREAEGGPQEGGGGRERTEGDQEEAQTRGGGGGGGGKHAPKTGVILHFTCREED